MAGVAKHRESFRLELHRHHETKAKLSVSALIEVLTRYIVFCGTTAGVERINAVMSRVLKFRGDAKNTTDSVLLKLISDRNNYDQDRVIGLSQELWVERFGHTRQARGCINNAGTGRELSLSQNNAKPEPRVF